MTLACTHRLALPLLAAGQAQKEVAHNEALLLLDMTSQMAAQSADLAAPPATPEDGQCWIVAAGASGAWAGREGAVAGWTAGGWRFAVPSAGWEAWVIDRGNAMRFDGTSWSDTEIRSDGLYLDGDRIVGARQDAIGNPAGGATVDAEARAAILAILATLRAHGLVES